VSGIAGIRLLQWEKQCRHFIATCPHYRTDFPKGGVNCIKIFSVLLGFFVIMAISIAFFDVTVAHDFTGCVSVGD
jgi:hypothetical protein